MDIRLPSLGEGADSGIVANIFVKVGDQIKKDQPILELESEKAVASIPSTTEGKVTKIHVSTGDTIKVGQSLVSVSEEGDESLSQTKKDASAKEKKTAEKTYTEENDKVIQEPSKGGLSPSASPTLRKLARDLGIDLTRVKGSEHGGRIVLGDVKAYVQRLQEIAFRQKTAPSQEKPASKPVLESIDFSKWGPVEKKKTSLLRKTIAQKMLESWTAIPHVTQFDEADITALSDLRKKHAIQFEKQGGRLTLTPLILKALVSVLKKHPVFNSSYDEAAEEIVYKNYYHVGIAVDTEAGLIVPVIKDVDKKSLLDLSKELEALAAKTRDRKIATEDLKGGTFTISNQGGIGGDHFTPIINKPEVAILGLGKGALRAVIREGKVVSRMMLPLGLSYDHRVIDGGNAARFVVDFVQALENFSEAEMTA